MSDTFTSIGSLIEKIAGPMTTMKRIHASLEIPKDYAFNGYKLDGAGKEYCTAGSQPVNGAALGQAKKAFIAGGIIDNDDMDAIMARMVARLAGAAEDRHGSMDVVSHGTNSGYVKAIRAKAEAAVLADPHLTPYRLSKMHRISDDCIRGAFARLRQEGKI